MGRKLILYITIVLVVFIFGCRKNQSTSLNSTPTVKNIYTSTKMNGNRIWLGHAGSSGRQAPPDAFVQFSATVLDDTSVLVKGDKLQFKSIDPISNEIKFYHDNDPSSHNAHGVWLYYDSASNSMKYSYKINTSYSGASLDVSTSGYKPNPLLKNYIADIIGARLMTGNGHDTFMFLGYDSTYALNANVNFFAYNDSTITFDKDFLSLGDKMLHYKSTDEAAGTITFQTFHDYIYSISTLTYNYISKHMVFEQLVVDVGLSKQVVLQ